MNKQLRNIRSQIEKKIKTSKLCQPLFFDKHVMVVEKFAKQLCQLYPQANKDVVLLSVWFHDIGRADGHNKDHDVYGAEYARKLLNKKDYNKKIIDLVYEACKSHCCKKYKPQSLEAKILATADALSHYSNGFYLLIFHYWSQKMDYNEARNKLIRKIEKDYKDKILLKEVKEALKPFYNAWKLIAKNISLI